MRLLSRFSAVEREHRLLLAFEALGEAGAFDLMRHAKMGAGKLYVILIRWEREGVLTSRSEESAEQAVADDGTVLPARRLYRLADHAR